MLKFHLFKTILIQNLSLNSDLSNLRIHTFSLCGFQLFILAVTFSLYMILKRKTSLGQLENLFFE